MLPRHRYQLPRSCRLSVAPQVFPCLYSVFPECRVFDTTSLKVIAAVRAAGGTGRTRTGDPLGSKAPRLFHLSYCPILPVFTGMEIS